MKSFQHVTSTISRSLLAVALLLAVFGTASAQDDFYAGKVITIVVPFSAGGGTDFAARSLAPYLEKHLPGQPRVIVQNQTGAGGLLAANEFGLTTRRDGTTLLFVTSTLNLRLALGLEGARVNASDFTPIAGFPTNTVVYAGSGAGLESGADLETRDEPLFLGLVDPIGNFETVSALELLGTPYEIVPGYGGRSEVRLALERGEVDIDGQTASAYTNEIVPLVEEGQIVPLFTMGVLDDDGNVQRDPNFEELPTSLELYQDFHGAEPSGPLYEAHRLSIGSLQSRFILVAHEDAPEEAVSALREAAAEIAQDPEFEEEAAGALQGYDLKTGRGLESAVGLVTRMDQETADWMREFLNSNFGVEFEDR